MEELDIERLRELLDFAESRISLVKSNKLTEKQKKEQLILIAQEIIELCNSET